MTFEHSTAYAIFRILFLSIYSLLSIELSVVVLSFRIYSPSLEHCAVNPTHRTFPRAPANVSLSSRTRFAQIWPVIFPGAKFGPTFDKWAMLNNVSAQILGRKQLNISDNFANFHCNIRLSGKFLLAHPSFRKLFGSFRDKLGLA